MHKDYWLTDGLYGSFNCILYDDQKPQPVVLRSPTLPAVEEAEGGCCMRLIGSVVNVVRTWKAFVFVVCALHQMSIYSEEWGH